LVVKRQTGNHRLACINDFDFVAGGPSAMGGAGSLGTDKGTLIVSKAHTILIYFFEILPRNELTFFEMGKVEIPLYF
jgi:hypothetical protein